MPPGSLSTVFISTPEKPGVPYCTVVVIAHYVGLSSFLPNAVEAFYAFAEKVIAHYVGLSSFLLCCRGQKGGYRPLCRAVFISTFRHCLTNWAITPLLSPTMSGCLHFYPLVLPCKFSYDRERKSYRPLCRAVFISTNDSCGKKSDQGNVIAHYVGLSSFLPHPFGSPVFMRVSEPVFACIFQNILTTRQKRGQKWAEVKLY